MTTKKKKLEPELVREITEYLLVETDLEAADLCFVFGNPRLQETADKAAEIYHKGLVGRFIVSGGVSWCGKKTEAEHIRELMLAKGVPLSAILIENKATNTGENVQFALGILRREVGLEHIESVIAIGRIEASRRYLMTMERHWPEVRKMIAPVNVHGVPHHDWHKHEEFRKIVLQEWNKIPAYKENGFITEIEIQFLSNADDITTSKKLKKSPEKKPGPSRK